MADEIEQIRARSADHMANVPNTHDRAQLDIATLLAHIDAIRAVLTPEVLQDAMEHVGVSFSEFSKDGDKIEADNALATEAALMSAKELLHG